MRRRALLKTGLLVGAGLLARKSALASEREWDFLIVGAGTAGLSAAIFAAKRGASVLLVDAAEKVGGTLHLANGQIAAAGTRLQDALGIKDSPDTHYEDVMELSRGLADPYVVRLTVDQAPGAINWLLDNGLVPLEGHPTTGEAPGQAGYSVRRYLWGANEGRDILAVVLRQLQPGLASGRISVQLESRVTGLLTTDAGAVTGVRATTPSGPRAFRGRHILLTTGGYAMNPALFERLVGTPAYAGGAYPYSRGDGLELATSVGGWLRGQHLHRSGTGNILSAQSFDAGIIGRFSTTPQNRLPWEIWVNNHGTRFIREDEPSNYARAQALVQQPEFRYAIVFDQAIFDRAPIGIRGMSREELLARFDNHEMFCKADSLEVLATKAKVDAKALISTVQQYNQGVRSGRDDLGRAHLPMEIGKPPFYAVIHLGSSATSATGVAVSPGMQVLRGDGSAVAGLYAAGELLGSGANMGASFSPGMMLTPALSIGKYLGETLPLG